MEMICDIGTFYSKQMHKILSSELEKKDKKTTNFELNEKHCVGVNNTQVSCPISNCISVNIRLFIKVYTLDSWYPFGEIL